MKFEEIVELLDKECNGYILYVRKGGGFHTSIQNISPLEVIGFAELQKQKMLKLCTDVVVDKVKETK